VELARSLLKTLSRDTRDPRRWTEEAAVRNQRNRPAEPYPPRGAGAGTAAAAWSRGVGANPAGSPVASRICVVRPARSARAGLGPGAIRRWRTGCCQPRGSIDQRDPREADWARTVLGVRRRSAQVSRLRAPGMRCIPCIGESRRRAEPPALRAAVRATTAP